MGILFDEVPHLMPRVVEDGKRLSHCHLRINKGRVILFLVSVRFRTLLIFILFYRFCLCL